MKRTPRPAAIAVLAAITALLVASGATGNSKAAPQNTKEPVIASQYLVKVGSNLQGNKGTWSGDEPITYTYQWLRCNADAENCKAIGGATQASYTITQADVGYTLRFRVTAKNSDGKTQASSNATQQIQGKAGAPQATSPPVITGTPTVGQTLNASNGNWNGTKPITYVITWERCNTAVTECTDVGHSGPSYRLVNGDAGESILGLPGVGRVGVGGPKEVRDVVRIERRPAYDRTGDRDGCGMDAVLLDTGGDQGRRRAQGGLPHGEARQCGHRMVGEAAAGEEQCAAAGGPQDGCGDLCRDDGAADIDVVCGPEPFNRRVEDLARIRQGRVVHGDARGARGAEDPLERRTVAVEIFDVCAHRLDLKPVATQVRGELLDRFAAGDERAAEAFAAEARTTLAPTPGPAPISRR